MRKLLSILTLVLSVLLVPDVSVSAPVRSALGSDGTEFYEEEDWENPYITDGLVAMWDGRWNVGGGMHDEDSTEWIDLIKGTAIPVENARLSFRRDALRFTSLGGLASFRNNNVIPLISGSHTIEVVCRVVEMPAAPGGISYLAVFNGSKPIRIPRFATSGDVTIYYTGAGNIALGTNAIGGGLTFNLAVVTDFESGKVSCFADGKVMRALQGYEIAITNSGLLLFDGVNGSGWAAGTILEICCIRVYNRALIPGEVAFNYNLDKARFGL